MQKNNKDNIISYPQKKSKLEKEVEAIIFAAEEPLDIQTIEQRVGTRSNIKILENLQKNMQVEELILFACQISGYLELL